MFKKKKSNECHKHILDMNKLRVSLEENIVTLMVCLREPNLSFCSHVSFGAQLGGYCCTMIVRYPGSVTLLCSGP